ncbi:hypothetical protein BKA62DRAFT_744835 [Auriculariales sp. MPI-PUGE-AT-0066]|nr:hypothetical protein BKA62DRAFT_744835 [Auriculariales sp. MPI-PUGE-AT-0066]
MSAGLRYPDHLALDSLPVLVHRPEPHAPIRALDARQLAKLRIAHDCLDTPDSVLFPFLHGLESGNQHQLAFFQKGAAVPDYRGLVCVLATDDDQLRNANAPSPPSSDGDGSPNSSSDDDDSEDDELFDEHSSNDSHQPHELYANDIPNGYHHLHRNSISSSSSEESSNSAESWNSQTTDTSLASSQAANDALAACPLSSSSSIPFGRPPTSLLTNSFLPSDLLSLSSTGPIFTAPRVPDGVSLRNFGIQLPIYATLSDIVVYSPRGASRTTIAVAERFKTAIEAQYRDRAMVRPDNAPPLLHYNVFVVTEPFSAFESDPELAPLVAVTASGTQTASYPDLAAREKEEMRSLTQASEILPAIFLGNAADVPVWRSGDIDDPCDGAANNAAGFDVCVECQDGAPFPGAPHLRQAEDHLAALDSLWATGVAPGVAMNVVRTAPRTPPRLAPNANAVLHLSCPSSPLSTQANIGALLALVEFLVRLSRDGGLHSHTATQRRPMRILVHSADGYTDSSVLALCLLMYARRCSLPEAYLELQCARMRSFFVYPQDLPLLRRVDQKLASLYPPNAISGSVPATIAVKREREKSRSREGRWTWGFGRSNSISISSSSATMPDSCLSASPSPPATPTPLFPPLSSSAPNTPTPLSSPPGTPSPQRRSRAATSAGSSKAPLVTNHHSWFNDPRFDGSFPSRVLPFLYLGNLNHAANVYMLHALGITHVVSVGECALVPPPGNNNGGSSPRCGASHPQGSLWIEEREGRIKVLDIKGVCDDGIDSLRSQFAPICDWIDRARLEGGKVLIHCRVGVSRSATVTIAYVMKHLNLPLVDSYLIVRSRRLSVLIQPNMRLLYNLCGWEAELAHDRVTKALKDAHNESAPCAAPSVIDDEMTLVYSTSTTTVHVAPVTTGSHAPADLAARLADSTYAATLQKELARKLTWPFLAREVHLLNEKYLS